MPKPHPGSRGKDLRPKSNIWLPALSGAPATRQRSCSPSPSFPLRLQPDLNQPADGFEQRRSVSLSSKNAAQIQATNIRSETSTKNSVLFIPTMCSWNTSISSPAATAEDVPQAGELFALGFRPFPQPDLDQ